MKALLTVTVLLLGACVSTPEDVAGTEPYRFTSKLNPEQAALCVIKATERELATATGRIEKGAAANTINGFIRAHSIGALANIEAEPAANGASVTIWLSRQMFAREYMLRKMTEGC